MKKSTPSMLRRFLLTAFVLNLVVFASVAQSCTANFTASVNTATKTATFSNTSSGSGLIYQWNFGDGHYSTVASPSHVYATNGTYIVSLLVSKYDSSCYSSHSDSVLISGSVPCNASFNYFTDTLTGTVYFNNTSSAGAGATYYWSLGDGSTSSATNPSHLYSGGLYYMVCLHVSSPDSSCNDVVCDTILLPNISHDTGSFCHAGFNYFTDTLTGTVYFNNLSAAGSGSHYFWTFGDGTASSAVNPSHHYTPGTFHTACLEVVSADSSCHDMFCDTIIPPIYNNPYDTLCRASFNYFVDTLTGAVYFNNLSTISYGAHYVWNFGDGITSTDGDPSHHYSSGYWHAVCLDITSFDSSCHDRICDTIVTPTYNNPYDTLCRASFNYFVDTLTGAVYFNNLSTIGYGAHYVWNFGDGTTSTDADPSHHYSSGYWHAVCLDITSFDSSCHDRICDTIVTPIYNNPYDTLCHASFNYFIDTLTGTIHFNNLSTAGSGAQYRWTFTENFADGSGSSGGASSINPVYHPNGRSSLFTVCLKVSSPDSSCRDMVCDTIVLPGHNPYDTSCNASFNYFTDTVTGTVYFNNMSTTGSYALFFWSFGDGTTSTYASPSHQYTSGTWHSVCLEVISLDSSCHDIFCDTIVAPIYHNPYDTLCQADFTYSADNDGTVHFTNNSTEALTYLWLFGDGGTSTVKDPSHLYAQPGMYHVTLIIPNCWDSIGMDIFVTIDSSGCDATFSTETERDSSGTSAATLHFIPVNWNSTTTYTWDFGDGTSSNDPDPLHTYASNGYYVVCLTIENTIDSCRDTRCDSVDAAGISGLKEAQQMRFSNAYPIPFTEEINLDIVSPAQATGKLLITDMTGKTILEKDLKLQKQQNTVSVDVKDLTKGIYFIELKSEYGSLIKKICK